MLVITRQNGKQIYLSHPAGKITVTMIEAFPYRAKIGIDAPASVNVWRAELEEKKPEQGELAIPDVFSFADRQNIKSGLSPLQLAYVERLEKIVRAADDYEDSVHGLPHNPRQYTLANKLILAMKDVDFLEIPEQKAS